MNSFRLFRDLSALRDEMNRLFGTAAWHPARSVRRQATPVNVYDSGEEYLVLLEAPGADKEKFDLSLTAQTLVLRGAYPVSCPEGATIHRNERCSGTFERLVELPGKVDGDKVQASFENGILSVRVAKAEEEKPRRISVQV